MSSRSRILFKLVPALLFLFIALMAPLAHASEAELKLPDLSSVTFMGGMTGSALLWIGFFICLLGVVFGLFQFMKIRKLPVHKAMLEISELIYETCKTYLVTQGKFIALLWVFIAVIMVVYFGVLKQMEAYKVAIIVLFVIDLIVLLIGPIGH